jgi:hypothetical protein
MFRAQGKLLRVHPPQPVLEGFRGLGFGSLDGGRAEHQSQKTCAHDCFRK